MKFQGKEIDLDSAALLLFLADNVHSDGYVKMSLKEISNNIGENPMWVSRHIKLLEKIGLVTKEVLREGVTGINAQKVKLKPSVIITYANVNKKEVLREGVTEDFEKIWNMYSRAGQKGNKTSAYKNYLKLPKKDKEDIAKYTPYYMAFTVPSFRPMMPKYIKDKYWQYPKVVNGRQIPMDNYFVVDIEKFKTWFNNAVRGTDIPMVTEVTPERHVNLNICYTLYPQQMSKAMKIVTTNEYWLRKAREGWLTFDRIFNPTDLIKICETGYGTER